MMVIPNETTHVLLTQHIYIYISIAANISNIVSMININIITSLLILVFLVVLLLCFILLYYYCLFII
jgi:hypothetical protein